MFHTIHTVASGGFLTSLLFPLPKELYILSSVL